MKSLALLLSLAGIALLGACSALPGPSLEGQAYENMALTIDRVNSNIVILADVADQNGVAFDRHMLKRIRMTALHSSEAEGVVPGTGLMGDNAGGQSARMGWLPLHDDLIEVQGYEATLKEALQRARVRIPAARLWSEDDFDDGYRLF